MHNNVVLRILNIIYILIVFAIVFLYSPSIALKILLFQSKKTSIQIQCYLVKLQTIKIVKAALKYNY